MKRLTYEQRVLRKRPLACVVQLYYADRCPVIVRASLFGETISGEFIRERDAWRSAWRNLKGRK